jgi:hypothetical protein
MKKSLIITSMHNFQKLLNPWGLVQPPFILGIIKALDNTHFIRVLKNECRLISDPPTVHTLIRVGIQLVR